MDSSFKKKNSIVFLVVLIDIIGFGIIIPLTPYLVKSLGEDAFAVGALLSIYPLMQFIFSPIWGKLSDYYGRKPFLLLSLLGSVLSYLLFALSTNYTQLFIARSLAGFFGASISVAMAYVADISKSKDRTKYMGLIGAAFGLGFVLGPALGGVFGWLGKKLGNTPPFGQQFSALMASVICAFGLIYTAKYLKESRKKAKKIPLSLKQIWKNNKLTQITHSFVKSTIGPLLSVSLLFSLAMTHMEVSLFLLMKERFNWSLAQSSLGFAYIGLIMVISQGGLIRIFVPLLGEKKLLFLGCIFGAVSLLGIAYSYTLPTLVVFITVLALAYSFFLPAMNGSLSHLSTDHEQGEKMGLNNSMTSLGRIFGSLLAGWLYRDYGMNTPFIIGSFYIFLGILVLTWIQKKLPDSRVIN